MNDKFMSVTQDLIHKIHGEKKYIDDKFNVRRQLTKSPQYKTVIR